GDRRGFRDKASLNAVPRRSRADQFRLQVRRRNLDLIDKLERGQGQFDREALVGLVVLSDCPGENERAGQEIQQERFAGLLEFALPRRSRDPQPGQAALLNIFVVQCAIETENDEAQQEQQQVRACEALGGIFCLFRGRLQELLIKLAQQVLGRLEALPILYIFSPQIMLVIASKHRREVTGVVALGTLFFAITAIPATLGPYEGSLPSCLHFSQQAKASSQSC